MSARLRSGAARLLAGGHQRARLAHFERHVQPALAARLPVHRFGLPPFTRAEATGVVPMAVCIVPAPGVGAAETQRSIEQQTVPSPHVMEGAPREALAQSRAPWTVLVCAGDRLLPTALERIGEAVSLAGDATVITADHETRGRPPGGRDLHLHPGPSPDLWLARDPAFVVMGVARIPALEALGGCDGSWHDLLLRLAGPDGVGQAHLPLVLCRRTSERGSLASRRRRVRYRHTSEPRVEAIVCFKDGPLLLKRCVRSLLSRSTYERLTLRLVDNASTDPGIRPLLDRLRREPRVTVDRDPRRFNFSALNNAAVRRSDADVVVLLNNDTEVVDADWIERLLEHALRPEVGAVAPLLTYPDGRVQHAGVAVGLHGWAGHPFAGLRPDTRTAFGAAADGPRNWLAVSAACMMVQRRKLDQVGGFDESFAVGGGDVDLCLRLTAAGYRSLCVPQVRVVHDESASRDPAEVPAGDFEASRRSYGAFRTLGDPFYHPALTLQDTTCRLRAPDEPLPST